MYYTTPYCRVCGRKLKSVMMRGLAWECSACTQRKTDPMYCERGCIVRYAHENFGYPSCETAARQTLTLGTAYAVESVTVHSCRMEIILKEHPGLLFSSTMFERNS